MKKIVTMTLSTALALATAKAENLYWGEAAGGDLCNENNWRVSNGGALAEKVPGALDTANFQMAMTNTLTASDDFTVNSFSMYDAPQKVTLNPGGHTVFANGAYLDNVDMRVVNGKLELPGSGELQFAGSGGPAFLTAENGGVLRMGYLRTREGTTVNILGGGTGEMSNVYIGYGGDSFCTMLLSGAGAYLKMVDETVHDVAIGYGGSHNVLEITDGAVLEGATVNRTVGFTVSGNGYAYGNKAFVHSGGYVTNVQLNVTGGQLIVSNAMFHCTRATIVGPAAGTVASNGIVVVDGGKFIAFGEGHNYGQNVNTVNVNDHYQNNAGEDNYILVSDPGTEFLAKGIHVGDGSKRNRLTVRDGAHLATVDYGIYVGGRNWAGLHHDFTLDRATAVINGPVIMFGSSNTVHITNGSVMTLNGIAMEGGSNRFFVAEGIAETNLLVANHFHIGSGCVVTNRGSIQIDSAESSVVIDNAEVYIGANGSRIAESSVLAIRGENSCLHSTYESDLSGAGTLDITVAKKGFAHQPLIWLGRRGTAGFALAIHADAWARSTGGEVVLLGSSNPYVGNGFEWYRDNATLDSPGLYWLEYRWDAETYPSPFNGELCQNLYLVLCAPPAPKGTMILVR